jgi:DNA-binding LacI/PurR family transcriptional regulator
MSGGKQRVTVKAVAEEAGCSFSAVAKVLNGTRGNVRVGPDLTARIEATAARLGYRPNYGARVLRRGRADTVGLLAGTIQSAFWGQMLEGVYAGLRESGYHGLVLRPERDDALLEEAERLVHEGRIDSVIVVGQHDVAEIARAKSSPLRQRMVLALSPGGTGLTEVIADPLPGVREAVAHLVKLGHRSMVYAVESGMAGVDWVEERWAVTGETAAASGITCRRVEFSRLAAELLDATAVLAANDPLAFKVLACLRESGCRIPADVSVIGFDDVHAHLAWPPLTTVHYGLDDIGRAAAELARKLAEGKRVRRTTAVASRLVVRQSTAELRSRHT